MKVLEVVWTVDEADAKLVGSELTIQELDLVGPKQGWEGPGDYIVPLVKPKAEYRIAPIPPSPG